jgi:hypothetical protein
MCFLHRELIAAVTPQCGLGRTLAEWQTIARALADTPRRRRRRLLS